ncbi:MAG: class I SAM-dependent methyltransferase [Bacteroidetes bacterium]|nr:class I SAM-dependent methyltransferase [Bacteroidota bacterium]
MKYDPIKNKFSSLLRNSPPLKILFFNLLRVLFLREWYIRRMIRKIFPKLKPKHILDAGMGFGQYSYFMSINQPKAKIDSVDLNTEHINAFGEFCRRLNLPIAVSEADLTKYVNQNNYDFILCVDVMEHIEDDRSVLKNFYASMKSGGHLLISTPSDQGGSDHDHDHDSDHGNKGTGFIDEHARDGYSVEDMTEKLVSAGFKPEEIRYTYGTFGKWSWKLAIKFPILLLNSWMGFVVLLPFYYFITLVPILILHQLDTAVRWKTGTGLLVHATKP